MAAELGLLPSNRLQKLAQAQAQQHQHQQHPNPTVPPSVWMWSPKQPKEDDDSWEVRAFAEDTGNIMGTTWPPRSYTCTFCRREFRSAQALGGHMNVHRRDRAKLHQTHPAGSINPNSSSPSTSSSTFIIPSQEFSTTGGLCLLYQLPNPNGVFTPTTVNACATDSPSTLLSISPYPPNNLIGQSLNFRVAPAGINSTHCYSGKAEPSPSIHNSSNFSSSSKELENEELDLELRLGHRSKTSPSSS